MTKFFLLTFLIVHPVLIHAQQLSIEGDGRKLERYQCSGFKNFFQGSSTFNASIENTDFYKLKKIKTISVYSNDTILERFFEFDSAGNILRRGENIQTCFKISSQGGTNPYYNSLAYYKDSILIRTDTTYQSNSKYKNWDTLMSFNRSEVVIYKSGALLNKQNNYFNENFYGKPILINTEQVNWLGRPIKRRKIYLKKKIKTDFEKNVLYLAKKNISENGFYAHTATTTLDTTNIRTHKFYKSYSPQKKTLTIAEGEEFDEPIFCSDLRYPCNNNYWDDERFHFLYKELTLNTEGLYEEYNSLYFPQDTNKAVIETYENEQKERHEKYKNLKDYSSSNESAHLYPPVKTPIKQRLYYFRYTYFQ